MSTNQPNVPTGYCECGCGGRTKLAQKTSAFHGHVKGRPLRYIKGHSGGSPPAPIVYEERDCGFVGNCWVWLGALSPEGYGRVGTKYAHRIVYEQHVGPIPPGLQLDHLCRNTRCVNPAHLEPVTRAENLARAGRLTREEVAAIRGTTGTTREIGRRFGIDHGRVSRIRRGLLFAGW